MMRPAITYKIFTICMTVLVSLHAYGFEWHPWVKTVVEFDMKQGGIVKTWSGNTLVFDRHGHANIVYNGHYLKKAVLKYGRFDGQQWYQSIVDVDSGAAASLALDPKGNPGVSYFSGKNRNLKYAYFDGKVWNSKVIDKNRDTGFPNALDFDSKGNPGIAYQDMSKAPYKLKYAYHNGTQWEVKEVRKGHFTAISFRYDAKDRPVIAFKDERQVDENKKYLPPRLWVIRHDGKKWIDKSLSTNQPIGKSISLAYAKDKHPAVVYLEYRKTHMDLIYAKHDGKQWKTSTVASRLHFNTTSHFSFDRNNNPAIAFFDFNYGKDNRLKVPRYGNLKLARHDGSRWSIKTIDGTLRKYSEHPALDFDISNNPGISYEHPGDNTVKFAYREIQPKEYACEDGEDNDQDGNTDCRDPECGTYKACM